MEDDREYQINCIIFKRIGKSDLRFLLLKRNSQKGGFWQSVTGGVHRGEDRMKAIKRELQEETGIKKIKNMINTDYFFSFIGDENREFKEYVYGIEIDSNQEITISKEHDEMKWVAFKDVLKLLKYESNKKGFRILYNLLKNKKG